MVTLNLMKAFKIDGTIPEWGGNGVKVVEENEDQNHGNPTSMTDECLT